MREDEEFGFVRFAWGIGIKLVLLQEGRYIKVARPIR